MFSCPELEEKHLAVCAKLNCSSEGFYLQDGSSRSSGLLRWRQELLLRLKDRNES